MQSWNLTFIHTAALSVLPCCTDGRESASSNPWLGGPVDGLGEAQVSQACLTCRGLSETHPKCAIKPGGVMWDHGSRKAPVERSLRGSVAWLLELVPLSGSCVR